MSKISRRDFLKGSGAAALTLAVAGLAGCSPKEGTTPVATPTPENTAAVGGAEISYAVFCLQKKELRNFHTILYAVF